MTKKRIITILALLTSLCFIFLWKKSLVQEQKTHSCYCFDSEDHQTYNFCYGHSSIHRKKHNTTPFSCNYLEQIKKAKVLEYNSNIETKDFKLDILNIVTGSDSSNEERLSSMIKSLEYVDSLYASPKIQLHLYDLGLSWLQKKEIRKKFESLVRIKQINNSHYGYSWQPIIVADMLQKYPHVVYVQPNIILSDCLQLTDIIKNITEHHTTTSPYQLATVHDNQNDSTYNNHPFWNYFQPKQHFHSFSSNNKIHIISQSRLTQNIIKWQLLCSIESRCASSYSLSTNNNTSWFSYFTRNQFSLDTIIANSILADKYNNQSNYYLQNGKDYASTYETSSEYTEWKNSLTTTIVVVLLTIIVCIILVMILLYYIIAYEENKNDDKKQKRKKYKKVRFINYATLK